MKDFLIAIASFLVVGLSNSYSIQPNEVQRTPVANASDGKLIFAHVVSQTSQIFIVRVEIYR